MYGKQTGEGVSNQLNINNSVYKAFLKSAVAGKSQLVSDAEAARPTK